MSIKNQNECSEILFLELINELEKKSKKTIQQENKKIPKEQILKEKKQIDFFNNNNIWFFSNFNTNLSKSKIEYPIIGNKWSKLEHAKIYNSEIKNLIFKSENEINYTICNCYIKCNVNLKGESSFWIFLRVQNDFSIENAIILYNREEYNQTVHISLGTFYENTNKELLFRPFIKQQLIFSKKKVIQENNNSVNLDINIYDEGNENITVETYLNDKKENNFIKGNFFSEIKGNYSFMIAGSGNEVKLKKFICDLNYKPRYLPPEITNNHVKGCSCCNIF